MYSLLKLTLLLCAGTALSFGQEEIRLDRLLTEALDNNPEIIAAQKRYEAARQRPNQESSLPDPMFSPTYASNGASWSHAEYAVQTRMKKGL